MKDIDYCFVYFNGRQEKLYGEKLRAKEFFYGYHHVLSKGFNTKILEFENGLPSNYFLFKFFKILQKLILKLFKFQYDFAGIIKPINWKVLKNSKNIILTNNRIAHSLLPFLLYSKITNNSVNLVVIAMGLFNSSSDKKFILRIHKTLHKFMIRNVDKLIFIGEPEFQHALIEFPKYKQKLEFIPFGVDIDFWKSTENNFYKKDYILFIGNDSNRDYEFLKLLINNIKNKDFIIVSENKDLQNISNNNVKVLKGSWNKDIIEDVFLRDLYSNAKLTIVPLKESLQPSGQSVSLQSMSTQTPVIITKTKGFWKNVDFKHLDNIYFTKTNNIDEWSAAINLIYDNNKIAEQLSKNAKKLVDEKFSLENYNKKLFKLNEEY